jgi:hypothetical protein
LPRGDTLDATVGACPELVLVSLLHRLATAAAKMAATALIVSLLVVVTSAVDGVVGGARQRSVQRGIDAHTVQVTARYVDFIPSTSKFGEDSYILSYVFEDQEYFETAADTTPTPAPPAPLTTADAPRSLWPAKLARTASRTALPAARSAGDNWQHTPAPPEEARPWSAGFVAY